MTRMGFGSRVVVTGDVTQIDLPRGKKSGLIEARRVLRDVEEIRFCELKDVDVVRHQLVKKVIKAYDDYYRKHPINEERRGYRSMRLLCDEETYPAAGCNAPRDARAGGSARP